MRKRLLGLLMVVLIVVAFVYPVQAAEPIKIGMVYTFTGSMAFVNQNIVDGHNFAIDEINKAGGLLGRKIEVLKRDDAGKADLATRYSRELITREGVNIILGGYGTIQANALAAVANEFKTPTFIFGGHATSLTTEYWSPYHFRYAIQTRAEGKGLAKVTAAQLKGVKNPKIYLISWDYEFGRDVARNFLPEIKKLVPNVKIAEGWPRVGEMDYSPFIAQILAYQPDVLVNVIFAGGAVANLKQSAQMGVFDKIKLTSACVFASNEYRKILGDAIPEGTLSWCYDDESWPRNAEQKKFYENFRKWKGLAKDEVVPGHVWPAYNMVKLYAAAVEKAGKTDSEAVCKALEGIQIDSYNGPISIRDFDHQVVSGHIWGPMVKEPGTGKYILDPQKTTWVPIEPFLLTKEQWHAARKAAGKE